MASTWCRSLAALVAVAAATLSRAADVELTSRCTSCVEVERVPAVNLLVRRDRAADLTLTWEASQDPRGTPATLYAGNPAIQARLPRRGELGPDQWLQGADERWRASYTFRADELATGTFVTVLVSRIGGHERIREWRTWRTLTVDDLEHLADPPHLSPGLSVRVTPWLLQADTGHGKLPPRSGDEFAWYPLTGLGVNLSDVDLDGESTGIPGLGIQVAEPWPARAGESFKERALAVATDDPGHTVRFEDFQWMDQPDRTVEVPGSRLYVRSYYTLVTLYTRATHRRYPEQVVGGQRPLDSPDYFAHETAARLDPPDGPQLWASYDERQHGRDPYLLHLLQAHGRNGWPVPGLGPIQAVDGDGGAARYTVGFQVQVAPWSEPEAPQGQPFKAGIVALDVVGARAGVGALSAQDGTQEGGAWCQVIGCGEQGGKGIDLHAPPSGYTVYAPEAHLGTISGALQVISGEPIVVPRGLTPATAALPELPRTVRFGLTADLRAGLLTRDAFLGPAREVYEINPYAQFVIRIVVAMLPDTAVVHQDVLVLPGKHEHDTPIVCRWSVAERLGGFLGGHWLLGLLALGGIALGLAVTFPALPPARAVLGLATAAVRALARALQRLAGWIGDRGA